MFLLQMNQISAQHFPPRASSRTKGRRGCNSLGWLVVETLGSLPGPGGLVYIPMKPSQPQAYPRPPTVLITWREDAQAPVPVAREASIAMYPTICQLWPCIALHWALAPHILYSPALRPSAWRPSLPPQHPLCFAYYVCFIHHFFQEASDPLRWLLARPTSPSSQRSLCAVTVCTAVSSLDWMPLKEGMPDSLFLEGWACTWATVGKVSLEGPTARLWHGRRDAAVRGDQPLRSTSIPGTLYASTHLLLTTALGGGEAIIPILQKQKLSLHVRTRDLCKATPLGTQN